MKVAIIFGDEGVIGGTHRVAACIIEALNSIGIIPDMYLYKSIPLKEYEAFFHKKINIKIKRMKNVSLKLHLYREVFRYLFNCNLKLKDYDFIYDISGNPLINPNTNLFYYIFDYNYLPEIIGQRKTLLYKIYIILYKYILMRLITKKLHSSNAYVFVLSRYVQEIIHKESGDAFPVLYPPADIKIILSSNEYRKNEVSSVSRFEGKKRQLDQIKIAEKISSLHFNIIGATKSTDGTYFNKCKKYMQQHNIKNVTLYPDLSFFETKKILENSKYYLTTEKDGYWSLVTIEGIATGCIPVVFNGGCLKEIVPLEELRFNNLQHAQDIFKRLENLKNGEIIQLRNRIQDHIKNFSEEIFKEKILLQLNKITS